MVGMYSSHGIECGCIKILERGDIRVENRKLQKSKQITIQGEQAAQHTWNQYGSIKVLCYDAELPLRRSLTRCLCCRFLRWTS